MAALEAPHVVLFKPTDLRLHDHAALLAAHEAASVVHLLVLDPRLGFGPGAAPSREAGLARIEGKRATFWKGAALYLCEPSSGLRLMKSALKDPQR